MRKKTHSEFKKELKRINPNVRILGKYITSNHLIKVKCKKCKHKWSPIAHSLKSGHGCPSCAGTIKNNTNGFKKELKRINPNVRILGEYATSSQPIKVKCKKCKHKWSPTPNDLKSGRGCPSCAGNMRHDTNSFKKELKRINPNIKILGEYITNNQPIKVKCKKCKHKWLPIPTNLKRGTGCPSCAIYSFKSTEPAVFYLYNINDVYLGFGITNNIKKRHGDHSRNLKKANLEFKLIDTFEFDKGYEAFLLEKEIKSNYQIMNCGVDGFRTEAVSMSYFNDVMMKIERFVK